MKIIHWIPKLGAILASTPAAVQTIKTQYPMIVEQLPPEWQALLSGIGLLVLGWSTKQVNVTGGTKGNRNRDVQVEGKMYVNMGS